MYVASICIYYVCNLPELPHNSSPGPTGQKEGAGRALGADPKSAQPPLPSIPVQSYAGGKWDRGGGRIIQNIKNMNFVLAVAYCGKQKKNEISLSLCLQKKVTARRRASVTAPTQSLEAPSTPRLAPARERDALPRSTKPG